MKMRRLGLGLGLALVVGAAPAAFGAERAEDFRWSGHVARGKTVEIKGVNGDVEATAGGDAVEVTAVRTARRSDPSKVEIKVIEHPEGVTICALYPTPASSDRPNECAPGRGGRMSTRDDDTSVRFTVKVPAGVRFAGRTVNGDVGATGLTADAEARSVNGSVKLEAGGAADAETVNGGVHVRMGRTDWDGTLKLRTVNGGITVELPADASTEVSAKTVNGGIDTDFPLTVTGRISNRQLRGTLGGGGRTLDLETVNGGIRLRKQ
jgi:DUF4097 and DUF4098 domain-containing protein YvlB